MQANKKNEGRENDFNKDRFFVLSLASAIFVCFATANFFWGLATLCFMHGNAILAESLAGKIVAALKNTKNPD